MHTLETRTALPSSLRVALFLTLWSAAAVGQESSRQLFYGPVPGFTSASRALVDRSAFPAKLEIPVRLDLGSGEDPVGGSMSVGPVQWSPHGLVRESGTRAVYRFDVVGDAHVGCKVPLLGVDLRCALRVEGLEPKDLEFSPHLRPRAPFTLDEDAPNEETLRDWKRFESIAPVHRIPGGFATSDRAPLILDLDLAPHLRGRGLESLVEWRRDGEVLGSGPVQYLGHLGTREMEVGPPGHPRRFKLTYYRVAISTDAERIEEGVPVTFVAHTDPPGHEGRVTWLSSTLHGSAEPTLGSGRTFTVVFRDTFGTGSFQWVGVRGDSDVQGQDSKLSATLRVRSNVDGVPVEVSDPDCNGDTDGNTDFDRLYRRYDVTDLTAPAEAGGKVFERWRLADQDQPTGQRTLRVHMDDSYTAEAVYVDLVTLTVKTNKDDEDTKAAVTASPADLDGKTGGDTEFELRYAPGTVVTLTAPNELEEACFIRWDLDGSWQPTIDVDANTPAELQVTMDADHTATAMYECKITAGGDDGKDLSPLLDSMVAFLVARYENDTRPIWTSDDDTGKRITERRSTIVRWLETAHADDRILFADLKLEVRKSRWGTLRGSTSPTGDKGDTIVLDEKEFIEYGDDMSSCHRQYFWFMGVIFHEAVHAFQNLSKVGTESAEAPKEESRIEIPAWNAGKEVLTELECMYRLVLHNRKENPPLPDDTPWTNSDGKELSMPPGYGPLTLLKTEDIGTSTTHLVPQLKTKVKLTKARIADFERQGRSLHPSIAEDFLATGVSSLEREQHPVLVMTRLQDPEVLQYRVDPDGTETEVFLDPRIARIVFLALFEDAAGAEVLMVGGTDLGFETGGLGSGILKTYRDLDDDGFFDPAGETLLISADPRVQVAGQLTQDPATDLYYLHDPVLRSLRELVDSDADGVPDLLTGPSIIPTDPLAQWGIGEVSFEQGELLGRRRWGCVVGGEVPVARFEDLDQDGFFETLTRLAPHRFQDSPPAAVQALFEARTSLEILARPGSTVEVDLVDAAGNLLQVLGTDTVPPDERTVDVSLAAALPAGGFVQLQDLTRGTIGRVHPIVASHPVVYRADEWTGPPAGGTVVTYEGEHLGGLISVLFDGRTATIQSQNATEVVVIAPPHPEEEVISVDFVFAATTVVAPGFEYTELAPPQPVADAGPEQTVSLGGGSFVDVVLDGTGSTDGGSPVEQWMWTGDFEGGLALGETPTVRFTAAGDYTVVLLVADADRYSGPVTTVIHVTP